MFNRKGRLERLMRFLYLVDTRRNEEVEGRLEIHGPRETIPGIMPSHVLFDMSEYHPFFKVMRDIAEECGLIGVKRYYTIKAKAERRLLVANETGSRILGSYCDIQRLFGTEPLMPNNDINTNGINTNGINTGTPDAASYLASYAESYATPEASIMFRDLPGKRSCMERCMDVLAAIKRAESERKRAMRSYVVDTAELSTSTLAKVTKYMAGEGRELLSSYGTGKMEYYVLENNGREVIKRLNLITDAVGIDRMARLYSQRSRKA